ncbi:MAG: 3-methyl-2-oxobutanoate dehydrogenase subunit VorB [Eubacteriales bacterium]|jgi:2-oxoglutarate ferredoxin oxidoreductase subunit alpha|nr:3-methyl-2-oxobutanoate dehydrogenase subunit VorB [Eubacteriales bacterium]
MSKVLMKGNEAIAEAAIRSGCRHYFGYPITPQTEIAEYMAKRMPRVGGLCLQAESEIAAINMVIGAAAAGKRAMTSSSSPGISLKAEGISYLVGCDLPCLILNIQRGGPGLGGIQPAQSDYYQATKAMGHGDMHIIVLAPSSIQEMASLTARAFDLGDKYRLPVMILADGALGQMMEPVDFDNVGGGVLPEKPWAASGHEGKRKKNVINSLYIEPSELENAVIERYKRYAAIETNETLYEEYMTDDAEICLVAYGITSRICKTAVNAARKNGIKAGLLRPITLWPYPKAILDNLADRVDRFLVVELNMGQMVDDVKIAINCKKPVDFFGRTGGMMPTPEDVLKQIQKAAAGGLK